MKLLAVETATEACSAAIYLDGEVLERLQLTQREHSKLILPMLDELLAEAAISLQDLDAVAFGRGPGSFTGVRIATGVIHGLAFGADLPVVPVSTLAAIAQSCFENTIAKIAYAAMDARMGEIYWGVYRRNAEGFAELMGEESVGLAEQVQFPKLEGYGTGSGWKVYEEALTRRLQGLVQEFDTNCLPSAATIVRLGAVGLASHLEVPVEQAMPVYLRDKVAKKESERNKL